MDGALETAIRMLSGKRRLLAFTGAGISTESGIPDFRGPDGVWTRIDPKEFTYRRYVTSAETRRRSWAMRKSSGLIDARPNAAHRALVDLAAAGLLAACVTQNIDGLHQAAGLSDDLVVELHGTVHRSRCLDCGDDMPTTEVLARVEAGEDDPHCADCGGILKAAVVSFGEMMPRAAMDRAFALADEADGVVAIGSTLSVYPAADVPVRAAARGVPYVIVNRGDTEQDRWADVKVEGSAGDVLPALAAALIGAT